MRLSILLCGLIVASAARPVSAEQPQPTPAVADIPAAASRPMELGELAGVSGGQAITVVTTDQALNAVSTGNSIVAGSVRSGDINFNASALSNFSGIGNFVVNTGNNNNLQGSLSVTVVPAPAMTR